ncbi:hypothetical protein ACFW04_008275 [Cataglyphis niger]
MELIDIKNKQLLDSVTVLSFKGKLSRVYHLTVCTIFPDSSFHKILSDFPELTRFAPISTTKIHHEEHHIIIKGPPIALTPCRLSPEKLKFARIEFNLMVEQRICRPSSSTWAALLHMVPKNGQNSWRLCGDYRALNAAIIPDRYALFYIQDFTAAYYQVFVAKKDIPKTAVTTSFGLFEFLVMLFGLCDAAQTFQHLINIILSEIVDFCFCYLDDILIVNETKHSKQLHTIFNRLKQFGMTINLSKSSHRQIRHLDFIIQFSTNIEHISGKQNIVADSLSRIESVSMPMIVSLEELAELQKEDKELKTLLLIHLSSYRNLYFLFLLYPFSVTVLLSIFILIYLNNFVKDYLMSDDCPWFISLKNTKNLPQKIAVPDQRFQHIHLDLIEPFPICQNFRYCLIMIDKFSRWPEAIPLTEISAEISALYGASQTITTDQDPQFKAALFKALTNLIDCERIRISVYHSAFNGILERWYRTLKSAIMCHAKENWIEILPTVLLGFRTCFKEDLITLGEFFIEEDSPSNSEIFIEKHRIHMKEIKSRSIAHQKKTSFFLIKIYTIVFI